MSKIQDTGLQDSVWLIYAALDRKAYIEKYQKIIGGVKKDKRVTYRNTT